MYQLITSLYNFEKSFMAKGHGSPLSTDHHLLIVTAKLPPRPDKLIKNLNERENAKSF